MFYVTSQSRNFLWTENSNITASCEYDFICETVFAVIQKPGWIHWKGKISRNLSALPLWVIHRCPIKIKQILFFLNKQSWTGVRDWLDQCNWWPQWVQNRTGNPWAVLTSRNPPTPNPRHVTIPTQHQEVEQAPVELWQQILTGNIRQRHETATDFMIN